MINLSSEDRKRVLDADQLLLKHARQFYDAIKSIADLASWRRDENVPPNQWWWYLDVIVQLPTVAYLSAKSDQYGFEFSSAGIQEHKIC